METPRLILKKIDPQVYQEVFSSASEEEQMHLARERLLIFDQDEFFKEKDKFMGGLWTYNKTFCYFLLEDKQTRKHMGWCGYHTWYKDHFRAELGYELLDENAKRKGLMTEAMEYIISYGFNEMNLHRIEALVSPENVPSIKVVEKFDFAKEGHLKQHYFKNNRMEDSLVYALLRKD